MLEELLFGDADLQWSSLAVSPRRTEKGVVAAGSSMDVCLLRTEDRYIMVAGWLRSLPFRWQWQLIGTNNRTNAYTNSACESST